MYGSYFAVGTALTVYTYDGQLIGLVEDGTITVTDKGDDIYRFDFDFTTPEGAHLTSAWEGPIKDYITDYTADGISSVSKNIGVKVDGNSITYTGAENTTVELFAANGARIASASGTNASLVAPSTGLYIVKAAGKTMKLLVK